MADTTPRTETKIMCSETVYIISGRMQRTRNPEQKVRYEYTHTHRLTELIKVLVQCGPPRMIM